MAKLNVERLEDRENPAVHFYLGQVMPSPQGDPGFTALFIQGDNPTHVHKTIIPPHPIHWHGVTVDRIVIDV